MHSLWLVASALFIWSGAELAAAQPDGLRINEVMASNAWLDPDNADFDDYSDWIELYNPTAEPISLDGCFLTDELTAPVKWLFNDGTVIPAGGYLVIRADDGDAGPGEIFLREFSPWEDFTTVRHHTNFKLAAESEEVGLFRFDGTITPVMLLPFGSTWRYQDDGVDPGPTWTDALYDDSTWSSGEAEFGYGEDDEATVLDFGNSTQNRHAAYYFRTTFVVADPAALSQYELRLLADDGAVVYLNGAEVQRVRMPEGPVNNQTLAWRVASEGVFDSTNLPPARFVAGVNTLAVRVHQQSRSSSDVSFDLQLTAKELIGSPVLVDSVSFGQQYPNVAWGRNADDEGNWYFFGEPTPGAPNTTHAAAAPVATTSVEFSLPGGFFDTPQVLNLTTTSGAATIHYTTDGSLPGSGSPVFDTPISIASTTVIRARAFEPGRLPGPVATQTYFVSEPERPLAVVSLTVNPAEFFDATVGIYTNEYKGREAAVHLEFFEPGGEPGFAVNAGAKIAGENIWRFAQKPLTITLRGKYGNDLVEHQIFPNERTGVFAEFVLRNGGDNWPNAMLRDALTPFILRGQSPSDVQNYRPAATYLNGQYWGIYNLREKLDPQYFATHHHLAPGAYDYLKYAHVPGNLVELLVEEGDTDAYDALESFAITNDLAVPTNYQVVEDQLNLDTFIDFVAAEDFVNNTSWRHNREFWRERRPGAKWHFVVPDLDRGFNLDNLATSLLDNMTNSYPLFRGLLNNETFRRRMAQRYAAHLSTTFHPQRISDIVDQLDAEVLPEVPRHIARWAADEGIQSLASRQAELNEIKQFAAQRAAYVRLGISNYLHLSATANLTVQVSPPGAGTVRLHGVPLLPQYSSTASLYRDIPVELEVAAAPGFAFAEWSDGLGSETQLTITLTGDRTLTATFTASPETVLPPVITSDLTLTAAGSPYTSEGEVLVPDGVTLTIEPGVTLRLPEAADLTIHGALLVNGEEGNPVTFAARNSARPWGVISFIDATGVSHLSQVVIRDASIGADPVNLKAAISNLRSTVVIEHADIEAAATIFARGGSTTLRSSRIYSPFTGDGINVKYGAGLVEDCVFEGNLAPDTDAIDFDGVVNGIIRRNRIYAFRGPNSDGIDVGEGCVNLLVSSNLIFNSSDKGISVGQASEVYLERNLIVGCVLGVGIKDTGSVAIIDQTTFANNEIGVAVYEKNLGDGGGQALVANSIFSRSKQAPVTVDALSSAQVTYSLSDTVPITGAGNFVADPLFNDAAVYDFSLRPDSPAIDAGDPGHAPDPDESPADLGAYYVFDPAHYPFHPPNQVVINEVMAHSHDQAPDWIELYNRSAEPLDIGGWYLSDSESNRTKYRIAEGTVLAGHGYLVLYENLHFGTGSSDPGNLTPFALSENGETVCLFGPGDGRLLDYVEAETFDASNTGVSFGRYFKRSSNTYNFVSMATPTPGAANSAPLVGPLVISEIMYHPPVNPDAEFIELVNITATPFTLFDNVVNEPWRFIDGINHVFGTAPPVTMAPGERLVLVRNLAAFLATYSVPPGTQIIQWDSGGLDNQGERLELAEPGDVDANLVRQFIRIDRVNFDDQDLWPAGADGLGGSLTRLNEFAYGNDVANWIAAPPTPGTAYLPPAGFTQFALDHNLPAELSGPTDDADGDTIVNVLEYVLGLPPLSPNAPPLPVLRRLGADFELIILLAPGLSDVALMLQASPTMAPGSWNPVTNAVIEPYGARQRLRATVPADDPRLFFRLRVQVIE